MDNGQLIKDIKENFADLLSHKSGKEVKPLINTIVRSLGRIKTSDKAMELNILKIAHDLRHTETGEEQLYRQQYPETKKTQYSESFFQSLNILKDELFVLLNKLSGGK